MKTPEERQAQIRGCLKVRKLRLKEAHLCQDCGKRSPEEGKTLCEECLKARRGNAAKK